MFKKITLTLLAIFLILFFVQPVFADFASSYQTFVTTESSYQSSHDNYLTARAAYLASQSLDSQNQAMSATLSMLQLRDNLISSYLSAISEKIKINQGISSNDQISLINQIQTEISWYNAHSSKLPSAGSLNDLVSDSNDAQNQFQNSTQIVIYQGLISLGEGDNELMRNEITNEISLLNTKLDEIKSNGDKDVSSVERSVVDVQNKISRSETKDNYATNIVESIKPNDNQAANDFQDAQSDLTDSNSYLKEANQELLQIIAQIKSA